TLPKPVEKAAEPGRPGRGHRPRRGRRPQPALFLRPRIPRRPAQGTLMAEAAATLRITCPSCQKAGNAPARLLGKTVRCSQCGMSFLVQGTAPGGAAPPAPAAAAVPVTAAAPKAPPSAPNAPPPP